MAEYVVSLDNEESNKKADNLSITGRVNGVQCAAIIRLSSIAKLKTHPAKVAKQKALIKAYLSRVPELVGAGGDTIEY